ncbi:MAG: hypothetical protein AAB817_00985 [Patescibacteria group bacterium]
MTTQRVVPTDEQLGHFARQQHDWFERVRKGSLDPNAVVRAVHTIIDRTIPADGEKFELTLDFSAPEADPIQMVRGDGYDSPEKWQFTGEKLSGVQTRVFKLVRVGYCRNLDEVRQKLGQYGVVPEGQWRVAFKAVFPHHDGQGPIGFADPSWVGPNGYVLFWYLDSDSVSRFSWTEGGRGENWRWLVPASPADKPASK